jgi:NADH-quinone oxidoreductase subunit G
MIKLLIDNIPVEVPEGTNVLEAARSVGIIIPHFCWHPALGRAGACRACAVKMLEGPVKGLQMSCMLPVQEGMVVSTSDKEALAMRKGVIEWLMINHPHDCPVCDEGGECQLQDFTIAGGHSIRRYDGKKRTYRNQYLGERIEHEMNRCIQCYRCVRFYQEYAGSSDFGVMGRAAMVYFGRQCDGPLESPFSGNLVDICPTGVFTDKSARFRARYWDYDMAPSLCPHCSLGCNTIPAARYRELLKVIARRNDSVNGWFICDRGRFSNSPVNAPDRPRQALLDGTPVSLSQALDALAERLRTFLDLNGPDSLGIVGSPRMSLEGNLLAARLRELTGSGTLCYFGDAVREERTMAALHLLDSRLRASQEDVRKADLVAILGCDLLEEGPMMALAVRQAWRNGARVFRIDGNGGQSDLYPSAELSSLADAPFSEAKNPVVICGSLHKGSDEIPNMPAGAKLAFVLEGPNDLGCALLARERGAVSLPTALESGRIKGLICFEADIPADMIAGLQLLAAADWKSTAAVRAAGIVLPSTAWIEMDGTLINNEGRAQRFKKVMNPGLPIRGLDPAKHPPRVHRHDAPGGDVLPAWALMAGLIERLGGERIDQPLSGNWEALRGLNAEGGGEIVL